MCTRVRLLDLKEKVSWRDIPDTPGVYWVVVPDGKQVTFGPALPEDNGLAHYQPENLQSIYDKNASPILYIGKANGKGGLRQRLRQYRNTLFRGSKNHRGGRAIKQIADFEDLYLEFEDCEDCEAREHDLLLNFKLKRPGKGNYPVANHRG